VGYRIGQLETLLQGEQRGRSEADGQLKAQEEKIDLLKRKLLEARERLQELERGQSRASVWGRLLESLRNRREPPT
jgi:Tfp pilus assembly protein PilN